MSTTLTPRFRIRNATLYDVAAASEVAEACYRADLGDSDMDEDFLHDEWVRPRFDPSTDAWVVTGDAGEVVAFAYTWEEEPHALFDSAGWVHPSYRGRGIGAALVRAVERRAIRDEPRMSVGVRVRVLQSFDTDASGARDPDASGARALLEGLGYGPEREYLHMEIEVPEDYVGGDAPAGISIRPRVVDDDPAIVGAMAEAFDDPWDYEEARQEWRLSRTYDTSLWVVATEEAEVVGALFGYIANGRGQISAVGVRPAWRRRGIGRALVRMAFVRFRDRGAPNVRLNVDRGNAFGATRMYERVGMRMKRRWVVVAKTLPAEAALS